MGKRFWSSVCLASWMAGLAAPAALGGASADTVVDYVPGFIYTASLQQSGDAAIGLPVPNLFGTDTTPYTPPWDGITIIGAGGHITLHLSAPVAASGRTVGVFSNVGLVAAFDPDTSIITAAPGPQLFSPIPMEAVVSVAKLPNVWVPLNGGNPLDLAMPTNVFINSTPSYDTNFFYVDSTGGTTLADPFLAFTGNLSDFGGKTYGQMLTILNNSAGGAWIDTSSSGLSEINYVKFEVPDGANYRLVLDSVTGIAAPEPASLGLVGLGAMMLLRRRSRR